MYFKTNLSTVFLQRKVNNNFRAIIKELFQSSSMIQKNELIQYPEVNDTDHCAAIHQIRHIDFFFSLQKELLSLIR